MAMLGTGAAGRVASNIRLTPGAAALLGWLLPGETLAPAAPLGIAVTRAGVRLARHGPGSAKT